MTISRLRETRSSLASLPGGWGWNDPAASPPPGLDSMQRAGVPVTAHTSLQVDAVFTALRVISNGIIKMGDLRSYEWRLDDNNEPYKVFDAEQPPILTRTWADGFQYDGRQRTVWSMGLFGEAFWYTLLKDRQGYPLALDVLHPAFMKVTRDTDGRPVYEYGQGSKRTELNRDDVTHIPFKAMPNATRGLSSIEYAGISFALALAAMEYGQRWFSQGASPGFFLSTDAKLGQAEVERIGEKFLVEHSGLPNAHLPLVVDNGLKPQKISATPDEAQFINTLEYARMCIASYFGLPSHLVGATGDKGNVWGKTVQEQGFQMEDFTFSGYTIPLEEAHSSLLPNGKYAGLDLSALRRANSADQAAEITALRQTTVATANDIRVKKLKWPPVEGGDELVAPLASNVSPDTGSTPDDDGDKEE